ncbi:hypothetical protein MMC25_000103 [Agyrium rufum]|nr:hypothetical protein [Agyrium rufum]
MSKLICVVDAKVLVDKIQAFKDLVYAGDIRLVIPICTSEKVEQIYQSSLQLKEAQKELPSKRSSYKALARKEQQPLFDINPRITREFLQRAQAQTDNTVSDAVTFQLPYEQFTQWREEEEKALKALKARQAPEQPPSSFAEALLRKLNIVEDDGGSKAPAKPRLVARDTASAKPAWKLHKVPSITSDGIPTHLRPLLSCELWRMYEFDNNPLDPESFVLVTDDPEAIETATHLEIPLQNVNLLVSQSMERKRASDTRLSVGLAEQDFGISPKARPDLPILEKDHVKIEEFTTAETSLVSEVPALQAIVHQLQEGEDASIEEGNLLRNPTATEDSGEQFEGKIPGIDPFPKPVRATANAVTEGEWGMEPGMPLAQPVELQTSLSKEDPISTGTQLEALQPSAKPLKEQSHVELPQTPDPLDEDSDLDIVVFKPKSRPASSHIRKTSDMLKPNLVTEDFKATITESQKSGDKSDQFHSTSPRKAWNEVPKAFATQPLAQSVGEPTPAEAKFLPQTTKPIISGTYIAALETGLPRMTPLASPSPISLNGFPHIDVSALKPPLQSLQGTQTVGPRSRPQTPKEGKISQLPRNGATNQGSEGPKGRQQRPPEYPVQFLASGSQRSKKKSPRQIQAVFPTPSPSTQPTHQQKENGYERNARDGTGPADPKPAEPSEPMSQALPVSYSSSSHSGSPHSHQSPVLANRTAVQNNGERPKQSYPGYRFNQVDIKAQRQAQKQPAAKPIVIDADSFDRSHVVKPAAPHHNGHQQYFNERYGGGRGSMRGAPKAQEGDVDYVLKSGAPRGATRGRGKLWVP